MLTRICVPTAVEHSPLDEGHMKKIVSIASFTDGLQDYPEDTAVVAIDVIRATTTAVTAVALGRRCYPVASVAEAWRLAETLDRPLLAGEVAGDMPDGFDMTNSPALLAQRHDVDRPIILLSSSGTQLMDCIRMRKASYVASFRNYNATIDHVARQHDQVVLIGAGSRGEFREEDQMCCAWIAEGLIEYGFVVENDATRALVERWRGLPRDAFMMSRSVEYLRRSDQLHDLDFTLQHFDDLDLVCTLCADEIVVLRATAAVSL